MDEKNKIDLKKETKTKISFDNKETWSNLKVADPHKEHTAHLECNAYNVEHCSLQLDNNYLTTGFSNKGESNAGILMSTGTVGNSFSNKHKRRTFISRNGGYSWDLAFDRAMLYTFADFGNIIVAMPDLTWNFSANLIMKSLFFHWIKAEHGWITISTTL